MGEEEVVGRGLAGDGQAALFGSPDEGDRPRGRDMGDVDGRAGGFGEGDFPRGDEILACPVHAGDAQFLRDGAFVHDAAVYEVQILAVGDGEEAVFPGQAHPLPHEAGGGDRLAVIRDSDGPGGLEGGHVGEDFPLHPAGDGGNRVDAGFGGSPFLYNITENFGTVGDGVGIGHAGDRGDAARGGRLAAGEDVLLVEKTGVAEVDVHVNEAGEGGQTGKVTDGVARLRRKAGPHGGEFPVRDADVAGEIDGVGGADDMQVLEDAGRHRKAPFWGRWMAAETSLLQKNQTVRGRQPGCMAENRRRSPAGRCPGTAERIGGFCYLFYLFGQDL